MLFNLESTEDYISIRNKQNYKMCDFGYDVTTSIFTGLFDSVKEHIIQAILLPVLIYFLKSCQQCMQTRSVCNT
jgi:hypothetical protein